MLIWHLYKPQRGTVKVSLYHRWGERLRTWNELSQVRRPDPTDFLFSCSVQPLCLLWSRWCFPFSLHQQVMRGATSKNFGLLYFLRIPSGFPLLGCIPFLSLSFFLYFTPWAEPYIFGTWPLSIWDTSCQLLIFIVVCWLCCNVSECSSVMEWIISLFDSLNLIFILFWVSYDSFFFFFCLLQLTFLFDGTTSIHPSIHLTFFNSTCDFYGFIFCLPLILHSFFIVTAMGEIRPGE